MFVLTNITKMKNIIVLALSVLLFACEKQTIENADSMAGIYFAKAEITTTLNGSTLSSKRSYEIEVTNGGTAVEYYFSDPLVYKVFVTNGGTELQARYDATQNVKGNNYLMSVKADGFYNGREKINFLQVSTSANGSVKVVSEVVATKKTTVNPR
jgi:hypothetical protein